MSDASARPAGHRTIRASPAPRTQRGASPATSGWRRACSSLAKGQRAIANWDEDAVTMVGRGRAPVRSAPVHRRRQKAHARLDHAAASPSRLNAGHRRRGDRHRAFGGGARRATSSARAALTELRPRCAGRPERRPCCDAAERRIAERASTAGNDLRRRRRRQRRRQRRGAIATLLASAQRARRSRRSFPPKPAADPRVRLGRALGA